MRHRVAHRKLGRVTEHRIAMLRNQATALLRHEHLTTTVPKAKGAQAVRRADHHDRQARGRPDGPASGKGDVERQAADRAPAGHAGSAGPRGRDEAVRHARAAVRGPSRRLHAAPAPRSPQGDSAELAQVELVGSEFDPQAKSRRGREARARSRRAKGVGGRLRAAAERLRGKKEDPDAAGERRPRKPSKARRPQGHDTAQAAAANEYKHHGSPKDQRHHISSTSPRTPLPSRFQPAHEPLDRGLAVRGA